MRVLSHVMMICYAAGGVYLTLKGQDAQHASVMMLLWWLMAEVNKS